MTDRDDEKPRPESTEPFLSRWSRRKAEAREAPPAPAAPKRKLDDEPAPELPPLDQLTPDSDFSVFLHPKVGEDVRRAALKKLFSDPRFNVIDGLDVYIDDYSKTEPIPPAMMATLRQAQMIFESARQDAEERERKRLAQAPAAREIESPDASSAPPAGAPPRSEPETRAPAAPERPADSAQS